MLWLNKQGKEISLNFADSFFVHRGQLIKYDSSVDEMFFKKFKKKNIISKKYLPNFNLNLTSYIYDLSIPLEEKKKNLNYQFFEDYGKTFEFAELKAKIDSYNGQDRRVATKKENSINHDISKLLDDINNTLYEVDKSHCTALQKFGDEMNKLKEKRVSGNESQIETVNPSKDNKNNDFER